jgi:GH24 family phage-related lysozyme (muramidase)
MDWLDDMIPFLIEQESLHNKSGVDVEGDGKLTYGYGHLDSNGSLAGIISGMSASEYKTWSENTLESDLNEAYKVGRQSFSNNFSGAKKNKHGYTTDYSVYDALPDDAKAIITDFQFNLGNIKSYPKLMNALKDGDWETVSKEYERSLKGKKLGKRNDDLFEDYIKPNLTDNKVFSAVKNSTDTPALDLIKTLNEEPRDNTRVEPIK